MAPATLTTPDTDASPPPGIDLPLRRLPLRQMSNTVIALDLGTITGWALRLGDRRIPAKPGTARSAAWKPTSEWVPSQNGLVVERRSGKAPSPPWPGRHSRPCPAPPPPR